MQSQMQSEAQPLRAAAPIEPKYRPLKFGVTRVLMTKGGDGSHFLEADQPLQNYATRMTDRFVHWAQADPGRVLMARRKKLSDAANGAAGTRGDWQYLTYGAALRDAHAIGQALLDRGLNAERPVLILSENGLEHAQLALACMLVGIPYCPASPAYSLVASDYGKLQHIFKALTPGLVFAADGARYGKALLAAAGTDVEVVLVEGVLPGRATTAYADLLKVKVTPQVDAAMQATGPDTIVKFLFTSGSTKLPKGVINTHRMWCANQQQMRQSMPVLAEHAPVLVDWLPWNHTFGGNHNVGMVLYNGGTLYIDDGKPTPALMAETLHNLREIAPTLYFNVPTGFAAIASAMKTDDQLRKTLLSKVRMFFYAGASLAQPVWDSLHATQEREIGERIVMGTGLGMTESSPFAIFITSPNVKAGDIGVPAPGMRLKLVPMNGKTEIRYSGPNITPGYWRSPDATASAFDEEGFFCTGDAVKWIDENDIHQGLKFDGRIAEDFKLGTGTFVSVGPLRAKIIAACAPYVQDVVLTGINLKEVGALVFPTSAVRSLAGVAADAPLRHALDSEPVVAHFQKVLDELSAASTGSANRIARMHLMHEPPSLDKGEVTDKGSINQGAVLTHRAPLVSGLHEDAISPIFKPAGNV
ncbi:MAG: feruloyl-CoA synthase [Pseudomonadota bacterium]